jgi:uncharacterized membrane protein YdjX (TVP38/TMEM64 family)
MVAGYFFSFDGLVVGQIGTFFSATLGFWIWRLLGRCIPKELFPSNICEQLEDHEDEVLAWNRFLQICALRNNNSFSFGWVNVIAVMNQSSFFLFTLATMFSSQPQIVLWVSMGTGIRAVGEKMHGFEEPNIITWQRVQFSLCSCIMYLSSYQY